MFRTVRSLNLPRLRVTKQQRLPVLSRSTANPSTSKLGDQRLALMEETITLADVVELTDAVVEVSNRADKVKTKVDVVTLAPTVAVELQTLGLLEADEVQAKTQTLNSFAYISPSRIRSFSSLSQIIPSCTIHHYPAFSNPLRDQDLCTLHSSSSTCIFTTFTISFSRS